MDDTLEQKCNEIIKHLRHVGKVQRYSPGQDEMSLEKIKTEMRFEWVDVQELLRMMEQDGYVEVDPPAQNERTTEEIKSCRLKYRGKLFSNAGGYEGKLKRERSDAQRIENNEIAVRNNQAATVHLQRQLNLLTVFIIALSLISFIWDIVKFCIQRCDGQ